MNIKKRVFSRRQCEYCESTLKDSRSLHAHIYRKHPEKLSLSENKGVHG